MTQASEDHGAITITEVEIGQRIWWVWSGGAKCGAVESGMVTDCLGGGVVANHSVILTVHDVHLESKAAARESLTWVDRERERLCQLVNDATAILTGGL